MDDPTFPHPPDPHDLGGLSDPGTPPPLPSGAAGSGSASAATTPPFGPTLNAHGRLADPTVTHEQRTYALLMHASIVLLHFMFFLSFVVPLVMWLVKRDQSRFIDDHGRETVNFHLTITLYGLVSAALTLLCIGWVGLIATYILAIVGGIMACLAASRAEYFRYPMCIRFIR